MALPAMAIGISMTCRAGRKQYVMMAIGVTGGVAEPVVLTAP